MGAIVIRTRYDECTESAEVATGGHYTSEMNVKQKLNNVSDYMYCNFFVVKTNNNSNNNNNNIYHYYTLL